MIKNLLLVTLAGMMFCGVEAQETGKFRVGLDLGFAIPKGGGGVLGDLEAKYNLADNMNVGFRFGTAVMAREVGSEKGDAVANNSFLGTYDYYFHNGSGSFAPFVGCGLGYYALGNLDVASQGSSQDVKLGTSGKFGGLLRTGFEWGKFRLGLEYNLIPKSKIEGFSVNSNGLFAESKKSTTVKNNYFGFSLGFYLGGGKWGDKPSS